MQIKPYSSFIPDSMLEAQALALLRRFQVEFDRIVAPPVPVERIADLLLELNIDWSPIVG